VEVSKTRSRLRVWARDTKDSAKFHLRPPVWDEVLGEELPFGADGEATFDSLIAGCSQYLEYGSGSSTFAVVRAGKRVVTVESDPRFLAAVERRCGKIQDGSAGPSMTFIHGDIGHTGPWGKPVMPWRSRPDAWRRYPLAPWAVLGPEFRADAVLVDGRFRVACALAVILQQPDTQWTMLVDDYVGRPEYEPITDYATLVGLHGRMAEFHPAERTSRAAVESAFEHFVSDWR
jgi:hypothetical protein